MKERGKECEIREVREEVLRSKKEVNNNINIGVVSYIRLVFVQLYLCMFQCISRHQSRREVCGGVSEKIMKIQRWKIC